MEREEGDAEPCLSGLVESGLRSEQRVALGGREEPDEAAGHNERREDRRADSPKIECPKGERDQRTHHSRMVDEIEDLVEPGTEWRSRI